jgi:ACS family glucarate transporter-like MFS transporter
VHGSIPWARFISSRAVWLWWMQYFCVSYGWYFHVTWLPIYLREARGLSLMRGAVLVGLPLFCGGIGCLISGWAAPHLASRMGSVAHARRALAVTGFLSASASILMFTRLHDRSSGSCTEY